MKKFLSVFVMALIIGTGTTGIKCPIFTDPEEGNRYTEQKYKENGYADYTFVAGPEDLNKNQNAQNSQEQPAQQQQAQSNPVKTCKHDYGVKIAREATCDGTGEMVFTCKNCKDSYSEVIAKTGMHVYDETLTAEPTCTEKGLKTFTCKNCDDTYTEEIGVLGHAHDSSITKAATCTEPGEMTYACKNCNDTYTEPLPATGHTSSEWEVVKENGLFTDGSKEQKCVTCGTVTGTDIIPGKYPVSYLYIGIAVALALFGTVVLIIRSRQKWGK